MNNSNIKIALARTKMKQTNRNIVTYYFPTLGDTEMECDINNCNISGDGYWGGGRR